LRRPNGEWLRLEVALPGYSVWLRVWQVKVGRVKLYLLDSNDAANYPAHRGITSELYGGGPELRLKQELLLGIGGWQLLATVGIKRKVCHLNEGHAAFAELKRARSFMEESGLTFEVALAATRVGNLFTTHTAVAAGFDRFSPGLIEQYLARYAQTRLGITCHDLLALGRQDPNDPTRRLRMVHAGLWLAAVQCTHDRSQLVFARFASVNPASKVQLLGSNRQLSSVTNFRATPFMQ
jgi:starch phosphorylase